jgi:isoleucyl-tRNA synthetase
MSADFWQSIQGVKTAVNKQLEDGRKNGVVGSSLEAEVDIHCSGDLKADLDRLGNELRFAMITSAVRVHRWNDGGEIAELDGLKVEVHKSEYDKCVRCWHLRQDVGSDQNHPELCLRCVDNVDGDGEERHFC